MNSRPKSAARRPSTESEADRVATARALYKAYEDKDRGAAERLVADDFRFTSPLDNGLDRRAYFEICWPNSERTGRFEFFDVVANGDRVLVTYELLTRQNERFRNAEVLTVRDGRVSAVEVYFGWNIPHDAPAGGHRDP